MNGFRTRHGLDSNEEYCQPEVCQCLSVVYSTLQSFLSSHDLLQNFTVLQINENKNLLNLLKKINLVESSCTCYL